MKPLLFIVLLSILANGALGSEDYSAKLKQLQGTINSLQKQINQVKSERDQLLKALKDSEVAIGQLNKSINTTREAIKQQQSQLTQLQQEKDRLLKAKQKQSQSIAAQLNQMYKVGQQNQLKLLLTQADPSQIGRLLKYHQQLNQARLQEIQQFLQTLNKINEIEPSIVAITENLQSKEQALNDQRQTLTQEQKGRQATLSKLSATLSTQSDQLANYMADKDRLQKLIDEAAKTLAKLELPSDTTPFSKTQGKLHLPTEGKIAHRFGSQRMGELNWNGIFIASPSGTPIRAVHYGRVVFADYLKGYGLLVIIDHGESYMSLYAHNQSLSKTTGDWVKAGETIALAGNTGGSTQAGLYFEIRHNGRPQNPSKWMKRG